MKKKTKLIAIISSFCLVLALGIVGVLAVTDLTFNMGGTVTFSAEGLTFTVSQGRFETIGGSAYPMEMTGKMQEFTMNTDKTLEDVEEELGSWTSLVVTLTPDHGDAILEFDVTNNTPDTPIQVVITMVTPATNPENSNIEFLVEGATIETDQTKTCKVTFNIKNEEVNVGLTNFEIKVDIIPSTGSGSNPGLNVADYMKEDTENQYYYVEMGTYREREYDSENDEWVETGNVLPIRWRYVSENGTEPYAYGTFPTTLSGYYVMETETFDQVYFNESGEDHGEIYANDYALSDLRTYLTGSTFMTKYGINESNPIYNLITPQSLADLYADIWYAGSTYSDIPENKKAYYTTPTIDATDKFFAPSRKEVSNLNLSYNWGFEEGSLQGYWFRSPEADMSYAVHCTDAGWVGDVLSARAAFIIE